MFKTEAYRGFLKHFTKTKHNLTERNETNTGKNQKIQHVGSMQHKREKAVGQLQISLSSDEQCINKKDKTNQDENGGKDE